MRVQPNRRARLGAHRGEAPQVDLPLLVAQAAEHEPLAVAVEGARHVAAAKGREGGEGEDGDEVLQEDGVASCGRECDRVGGAPREGRSEHVAVQAGSTHPPLPRGRGRQLEGQSVNGRPLAVGGNERQLQHLHRSRVCSDLASTPRGSAGIFIRCITCQSKGAAAIQSARRKFAPVPQYFSNANDGRSIIMPMASGCVGLASGGRLALACRNASRCETSRASSLKPRPISSHLVAT